MATILTLEARKAEYALLQLALPGRPLTNFGVLLFDPDSDRLYIRLREDCDALARPEDAEVLALLAGDMEARTREMGGRGFLEQLEDSLSNVLRITAREPAAVRDFPLAMNRLFEERVLGVARERATVVPFVSHLPLYSLRAAAGRFGEDMEAEPEGWVSAPAGVRPARDLYVVHVAGRSMEPEIPDGSLAVFRHNPAGSRQGKRVLVWRRGASEQGGEFTIKVYESVKRATGEGWRHDRIRLKPLNPEYETLELDDDSEYRVLGEFVAVIPLEEAEIG